MIDSALDNLLEVTLTPERYKLYIDVISYLESIEYDTIQDELLNFAFMSIADDEKVPKPESTVADEIHGHLMQCIITQLRITGIEVVEDVVLKDIYDLAVGIKHIPSHEDMGSIIASCSTDDGPIDQLAEVLHLVTTIPTVHWTMVIDSVSDQLIKKIQQFSSTVINSEYEEVERMEDYLQKLRVYKEYTDKLERELLCYALVETNIIGREFETYINSGILTDYFEGNQMDLLALEIYGVALMSSDARNDPPAAIRTIIEKYLSDSVRIVKLNAEVAVVNGNFVKFFQTATNGLTI